MEIVGRYKLETIFNVSAQRRRWESGKERGMVGLQASSPEHLVPLSVEGVEKTRLGIADFATSEWTLRSLPESFVDHSKHVPHNVVENPRGFCCEHVGIYTLDFVLAKGC